ncbi:MAG: hypothetical protein NC123_16120 [Butyrivibrio sp.]|nr:hypothetical protein [Acetatifactor muris]MCM1561045.1 hypothetical protein [Butyrivibrio sp.]
MKKTVKDIILILLVVTLGVTTALFAYLHFSRPDDRNLTGEWVAELDMTEQAAVTALGWLQEIEAVSVSLEDMEAYMQDLTVQVSLTMEQTGRAGGSFRCRVLPESYEACRQAAYEGFAGVFLELLTERLHMAGYTGSTDRETLEGLVTETFGMSAASYLMACGPALLPSLEELQAKYEGSGTYEAADGILIRRFAADGSAVGEPAAAGSAVGASASGGPAVGESAISGTVVISAYYIRQASGLIVTGPVNEEADIDADTTVGREADTDSDTAAGRAALPGGYFDDYPILYTLKQSQE